MTDALIQSIAGAAATLSAATVDAPNRILDDALIGLARWLERRHAYEPIDYAEILMAGRCLRSLSKAPLVWEYALRHARRVADLSVVVH